MRLQQLTKTCWLATNEAGLTRAVRVDLRTMRWTVARGFSEADERRALWMAGHAWSAQ